MKISRLFEGLVSSEVIRMINDDFESVGDIDVMELGIDSLAIMELILRIEEVYEISIDYESFCLDEIKTPRRIKQLIENTMCKEITENE